MSKFDGVEDTLFIPLNGRTEKKGEDDDENTADESKG